MNKFRFSPITSEKELLNTIEYLHIECHRLINKKLGKFLPVAGDVCIFCHFDDEYEKLTEISKDLVVSSKNQNQKYFQLKEPFLIPAKDEIPAATYEWLYIRKPNPKSPQVGDIDFVLTDEQYNELKESVTANQIKDARVYDRPGWDMIEILENEIDALPYICTKNMAEKVRVKFE